VQANSIRIATALRFLAHGLTKLLFVAPLVVDRTAGVRAGEQVIVGN
jgi:hypothetical protein